MFLSVVIVNLMNKMVYFEAHEQHLASTVSDTISRYTALYGRYDTIATDPGSELMSKIFKDLMIMLRMKHKISLVMRHESCGVEQSNREILFHLRCLCMEDLSVKIKWSESRYLHWVMYTINNIKDQSTNLTPYEKMFGRIDSLVVQLNLSKEDIESAFIKEQQRELQEIQEIVTKAWSKKLEYNMNKVKDNYKYSKGDLVVEKSTSTYENNGIRSNNKLLPIFIGPYEVKEQTGNVVSCQHLALYRGATPDYSYANRNLINSKIL